jgi:hypothetical protein
LWWLILSLTEKTPYANPRRAAIMLVVGRLVGDGSAGASPIRFFGGEAASAGAARHGENPKTTGAFYHPQKSLGRNPAAAV